jgi:hypothetical protein
LACHNDAEDIHVRQGIAGASMPTKTSACVRKHSTIVYDIDGRAEPPTDAGQSRVATRASSATARDRLCGGHAITVVTAGASGTGTAAIFELVVFLGFAQVGLAGLIRR